VNSRRERNARSRRGTNVELQFVNVVPNGDDQKAQTRSIIRANAAHFHWRHNRPQQDKSKSKEARHVAQPSSRVAASLVPDHVPTNEIDQLQSSTSHLIENSTVRDHEGNHGIAPLILLSMENPHLEFKVDPFSSFASELPTHFVSRCIIFSKRYCFDDTRTTNYLPTSRCSSYPSGLIH
jgi:hypothetical protein